MIQSGAIDSFLAACLRREENGLAPEWPAEWDGEDDQRAVWRQIAFHGIHHLLAASGSDLTGWPDWLAKRVRDEARLMGLWEETHSQVIRQVVDDLACASLEQIVMKGTALAYSLYDDPAARRRGDTDLLVRADKLNEVRQLLEARGFIRGHDPHGLYFQETWIYDTGAEMTHSIDLHWEPTDKPVLQRVLRVEEFFAGAIGLPRLSPNARAPDPVLSLVQIALNQAWHYARGFYVDDERVKGGRRLIWSKDYALLVRQFASDDWERLAELCEDRSAGPFVHAALVGAEQDFGSEVPPDIMRRIARPPCDPHIAIYLARTDRVGDFKDDFRAARSMSQRTRLLANTMFAPRDHLIAKYPHLARWPTFALQLRRLAEVGARALRLGTGR